METPEMEQWWIDQFQGNLSAIRKVAGWTTQRLADELGVARQTVSNLETGRTAMTKLQYLALRTVFNAEIAQRDNQDLAKVIKTLVDDPVERRIRDSGRLAALSSQGDDGSDGNGGNDGDVVASPDDTASLRGTTAATSVPSATSAETTASRQTANGRKRPSSRTAKPPLSAAMQMLAVITAALASGTAAGVLTYIMFPDGGRHRR